MSTLTKVISFVVGFFMLLFCLAFVLSRVIAAPADVYLPAPLPRYTITVSYNIGGGAYVPTSATYHVNRFTLENSCVGFEFQGKRIWASNFYIVENNVQ